VCETNAKKYRSVGKLHVCILVFETMSDLVQILKGRNPSRTRKSKLQFYWVCSWVV